MLEELNVHNYALIDRVNVKFSKGFNVLTGETGAGKSILVDALGLLLGQKTSPSVIRSGSEETLVSGVIRVSSNSDAGRWMAAHGISPEDGTIILRRVVKRSGRGAIYAQSVPVTRTELAELASLLFDLHGQHDHQSLLKAENHRKLLDRYGGNEELAESVSRLFHKLAALNERYQSAIRSERERLRETSLLRHAIDEIDGAELRIGEEEELEKEHTILANHERLFRLLEETYGGVAESRGGSLSSLRASRAAMDELVQIDTSLSGLNNQLQDAFYELEDFAESVRAYKASVHFDPEKLVKVEERLKQIRDLEKKYGDTIEEILEYAEKCRQDLEGLENWEEQKQILENEIGRLDEELCKESVELHRKRTVAASDLQQQIEKELIALGMPKVRFRVLVQERKEESNRPAINQNGMDLIEFVISPNVGEPFKRLRKIASGGELSRVMLAIKSILAESDHIGSLIFDEVDVGIGGEVAIAVGKRLQKLSALKQILCITHLATIAVRADNHLLVEKQIEGSRTITRVAGVRGDAKKREISRMLAGDKESVTSLKHAEELLGEA
jgi:DNA repair protein RecN (Recombination protein N)